jgi:hypothetical protein
MKIIIIIISKEINDNETETKDKSGRSGARRVVQFIQFLR